MQVADAAAALGDGLAVELEDQPEHAVRGRVLRAHVDDDALVGLEVEAGTTESQSWPVTVKTLPDVGRRCARRVRVVLVRSVLRHQL